MREMDKEQDWLSRERLELYVIVNLAHGRDAQTFPINTQPELPRFRVLKDAIDSGELSALPGTRGNPNADAMSRVGFSNLWTFAAAAARREELLPGLEPGLRQAAGSAWTVLSRPPKARPILTIPDCLGGQR